MPPGVEVFVASVSGGGQGAVCPRRPLVPSDRGTDGEGAGDARVAGALAVHAQVRHVLRLSPFYMSFTPDSWEGRVGDPQKEGEALAIPQSSCTRRPQRAGGGASRQATPTAQALFCLSASRHPPPLARSYTGA